MWRVPMGPISIRPMGPDGLRVTCTYGAFLHLHPTCGARRHLSPSPSNLWDPTACVSRVAVGPFSISIKFVGPDGLCVTCGPFSIWPVGPDGLHVTCTCGTFLHLHPTCGTRRLARHLYLVCRRGLIKSNSKNHETSESNPGPRARNGPFSPLR
jgi:hypothetical protein